MTPQQATTPNTAVLLERIEQVRGDIAELKAVMACSSSDTATFRQSYIQQHVELKAEVGRVSDAATRAHKRIDDLEGQVRTIGEAVKPLIYQSRILAWASSLIGGALILGALSFIWAIATHQVVITTVNVVP